MVVSFQPGEREDQEHLDAVLHLRETLPHPDLSEVVSADPDDGLRLIERPEEVELRVPGTIDPERAHEIEEVIWERMHFASHLREQRLGEFTIGTQLQRSDSLAVVQLLIFYHVVTARAVVALGGKSARPGERQAEDAPLPVPEPFAPVE